MQEFALLSVGWLSDQSYLILSQSFVPQFRKQEVGGDITDKERGALNHAYNWHMGLAN